MGSYVGSLRELKEVVALAKKRKIRPAPVEVRHADEANAALEFDRRDRFDEMQTFGARAIETEDGGGRAIGKA